MTERWNGCPFLGWNSDGLMIKCQEDDCIMWDEVCKQCRMPSWSLFNIPGGGTDAKT